MLNIWGLLQFIFFNSKIFSFFAFLPLLSCVPLFLLLLLLFSSSSLHLMNVYSWTWWLNTRLYEFRLCFVGSLHWEVVFLQKTDILYFIYVFNFGDCCSHINLFVLFCFLLLKFSLSLCWYVFTFLVCFVVKCYNF